MHASLSAIAVEQLRAHLRTIPRARITLKNPVDAARRAAVLVPLCVHNNVPSILFTKRPATMANHPGQVAFPGGKIDATDRDETDAALRELHEETGIARDDVDVVGLLPDAIARSKHQTVVTPVIGVLRRDLAHVQMRLSAAEVESAFTIPLSWLLDVANRDEFRGLPRFRHPSGDEGRHVWGFSGFVLERLLAATQHVLLEPDSVERSVAAHRRLA